MESLKDRPIINCHTHIFTSAHVPPFLAKTYVPWPFYYLLHLGVIVFFFKKYYRLIKPINYMPVPKWLLRMKAYITWALNMVRPLKNLLAYYITLQVFFILYDWLRPLLPAGEDKVTGSIESARSWLAAHWLLLDIPGHVLRSLLVICLLLFIPSGRNLIFFVFRKIWQFLAMLPGKQTTEMLKRYLNIGRYAFHEKQSTIFGKMQDQYPADTGFVILPMDMEFMSAGPVTQSYRQQMSDLAALKAKPENKDRLFPFVFADPRRFKKEADYFRYTVVNNTVQLEDCFVKEFLIDHKFSGIKLYPALGYFPFDEELLPLFKYAADNGIPLMTHCIRGTIFYRGRKKFQWNKHPVFNQAMGGGRFPDLILPEADNVDFSVNFTHPMNYLCLLDETLLRQLVGQAKDQRVRDLFGYVNKETALKTDLRQLKLCFGHFGGEDEFLHYFEKDRFGHSAQLMQHPYWGISFLTTDGVLKPGKPEQLWRDTDWYSIICSMMLQYPNVYADISYILHSQQDILSLLKETLAHDVLQKRVLYGTDFYVVRNHKSDKNLLADTRGGLDPDEFEMIAKLNPRAYLQNRIHGEVKI